MTGEGVRFRVTDTQKKVGDLFVHLGTVEQGTLKVGTALQLEVDHARRSSIRANHSATHLLHEALRQVLGDHVAQRGSLVAPDRLRFDFVHPKPITAEELARVEDIANEVVLENDEVDDAADGGRRRPRSRRARAVRREIRRRGPRGLDGQGPARRANALGWSVELCGGTHVRRTGDIGLISVTGESAVASGVRRIEALTGRHARKHANDTMALREDRGVGTAHHGRRHAGAHRGADGRAQEARARSVGRAQEARDGRRRGNGAAAPTACAKSATSSCWRARSRASRPRISRAWSTTARSRSAPASSRSSASPRTARPASSSASPPISPRASTRSIWCARRSEALGGKGGGGRPDMAQAGGPDGAKADAALSAIEQAMAGA